MIWRDRSRPRPGAAVFEQIRQERRAALRRHFPRLLLGTAIVAFGGGITLAVLLATGHRYQAAFMAGVTVTGWFWLLDTFFTVLGTSTRRMGGTAEQWTAKALLQATGGRHTVLHHLDALRGDVDHVVISGDHVLAVETKWTASKLRALENGHLAGIQEAWLSQTRRGADWVDGVLGAAGQSLPVTPVLMLWGPAVERTKTGRFNSGRTQILIGHQQGEWTSFLQELLGEETADIAVVDAVVAAGYPPQ